MGYMNEFPHTRNWDSDLREILELVEAVKNLPKQWAEFKDMTLKEIDKEVQKYLGMNLESLLAKYVYEISYNEETETIVYIRKENNNE